MAHSNQSDFMLHSLLAFSTSGFTKLFTTSIWEGTVADKDALGSGSSDSDAKFISLEILEQTHKRVQYYK